MHVCQRIAGAFLLLGAAALPAPAQQAYPTRPVTLTHGFAAGGNGDVVSRIVADALGKRLGQPVVVERRHHRLGIEIGVGRLVIFEGENVDVTALPVEAFFREAHADLLRANRTPVVIQSEHLQHPGI